MAWNSSLHFTVLLFFWAASSAKYRAQNVEGKLQWTWQLFPEIGSVLENIHWLAKKTRGSPRCFLNPFFVIAAVFGQKEGKKVTTESSGVHLWHCLMRKQWLLLNHPANTEQTEHLGSFLFGFCFEGTQQKLKEWQVSLGLCCSPHRCCRWFTAHREWGECDQCCPSANSTSSLFCSACDSVPSPC